MAAKADEESFGRRRRVWRPLDGAGCAAFELPGGETDLTIEWVRWAVWNDAPDTGNQLVGYRCDAAMTSCDLDSSFRTVPASLATGITEVIVQPDDAEAIDLVFWAATPGHWASSTKKSEGAALGGGVPELLLYEGTVLPGDQPVEQAVGDWYGFFLKPLQWEVDPGSYVIEVRHSGGGSQPYSLAVALLPDSPCPPP